MERESATKQRSYPALLMCIIVAFACASLSTLLVNQALFPLYDAVFTYARDISIVCAGLVLIALAIAAMHAPAKIDGRFLCAVAAAFSLMGTPLVFVALRLSSIPTLVVGACLVSTARSWCLVCASVMAINAIRAQAPSAVMVGVPTGYLLASGIDALFLALPISLSILAALGTCALPLALLALTYRSNRELFDNMRASEPAADLSVTRPETFLPLTSTLYVLQFIVFIAFGFALRFGEVEGTPVSGQAIAAVALALLIVWVAALKGRLPYDSLCNVVLLILIAGLSLAAVGSHGGAYVANSLLMAGNALYNVLVACTLIALAARNHLNALAVFGWANGLASLGTTLGAAVGVVSNHLVAQGNQVAASYLAIAVALTLVAYALFALRGFSFRTTIEGVVASSSPSLASTSTVSDETASSSTSAESREQAYEIAEEAFSSRCKRIAEDYGLTPREAETFSMLARGRNREYIEEQMQVSRNTVKAHVKHVYAKLGIHSHQELLDLVENSNPGKAA